MLFGIIIVLVVIVAAILLNKTKLAKSVNQVEETVAPAIEEVKEVVEKSTEVAPAIEEVKKAKEATKQVATTIEASVNSVTIWFNQIQDGEPPYPYGYIDAGTACSVGGSSGQTQIVYYKGILGDGNVLYNDSNLTENFSHAGSFGWYWINFHKFTYDFNSIANYSVCD